MLYDVTQLAVLWMVSALLKARIGLSGRHVLKRFQNLSDTQHHADETALSSAA